MASREPIPSVINGEAARILEESGGDIPARLMISMVLCSLAWSWLPRPLLNVAPWALPLGLTFEPFFQTYAGGGGVLVVTTRLSGIPSEYFIFECDRRFFDFGDQRCPANGG
jgi:hypothetical protein